MSSQQGKPRLLVLASTYPRWLGDHEPAFVHELSKRLVDRFQVTVLCPHAAGAAPEEVLEGVRVLRYRYAPVKFETLVNDGGIVTNLRRAKWKLLLVPTFVLAQAWAVWRLLQRERIDVVHAHWLIPQGFVAALLQMLPGRLVPFVVTSHGADLFALRTQPLQAMKRCVLRQASAVTVVSCAMKDEMATLGMDTEKVQVQPMGVDLEARFVPNVTVARSRDEILFVGRLVEKKGLRHLIDAMSAVIAARPAAILTIAGFGPEERDRRAQVERMGLTGKVHFLGPVPQAELPALYSRAAVFVAPFVQAATGDQEGLGLVLVEAAGCGCPIVVGRVPAVRDLTEHGLDAIVVDARDSTELASAILSQLQVDDSPSTARERAKAVVMFGWNARAQAYAGLLTNAMARAT